MKTRFMVGVGEHRVYVLHENHFTKARYERGYKVQGNDQPGFMACSASGLEDT